ncbi:hypothetical protein WJX81_008665 [Elliptochloris bilobata]|uniref:Thaumatin-like protein n=1 Tax=Elliptochloris bilobata TaxID=381761 RepID=A0AAW1RG25_9CHLO
MAAHAKLLIAAASALLLLPGAQQSRATAPHGAPEPAAAPARSRTFTLVNKCTFTVWPVARGAVQGPCATGACAGNGLACTEDASAVPMDRTQAEFNLNSWADLDYYDLNLFTANLAQFLFNSFGGLDLYTIILDYANVPVLVQPSVAASGRFCQRGGCTADLRDHCPAGGAVLGPSGQQLVCRSACEVRRSLEQR